MSLEEWLDARILNTHRLAATKKAPADIAGWLEDAEYLTRARDAVQQLAEANARLAGKWISVEERLPEIGIPLLFTTNESAIELGMRCFDDGTQIFQCERTGPRDEPITFRVKDGQVTHWQPLPAPPAAKEEADANCGSDHSPRS